MKGEDFSRVNRPPANAARYYSRLAPWYDFLASSEKRFIRKGLDLLSPQPGNRILEIGFGTGYALQRILPHLKEGYYAGLDLSPGMARLAKDKLAKSDHQNRAGLACSDSLPLPFAACSFDAIFSSFTLELFDTPHIPVLLRECQRVLKTSGRLVVVSLSKDQPLGMMGKVYERFHDRFPTIADCRPIPVRRLLEEGSFTIQDLIIAKMWGLPIAVAAAQTNPDRTGQI